MYCFFACAWFKTLNPDWTTGIILGPQKIHVFPSLNENCNIVEIDVKNVVNQTTWKSKVFRLRFCYCSHPGCRWTPVAPVAVIPVSGQDSHPGLAWPLQLESRYSQLLFLCGQSAGLLQTNAHLTQDKNDGVILITRISIICQSKLNHEQCRFCSICIWMTDV